jgi:hypothetical protein
MDRLAAIIEYQFRAHWRHFSRAGKLAAGNRGIIILVTGLILIKYFRLLNTARIEVAQGKTALLSFLLAGVFVACVSVCLSSPRTFHSLSGLRRLPLSISDLFVIRIVATFMTPFSWMVTVGAFAILYPIAQAPKPAGGIIAASMFIFGAWATGLVFSNLLANKVWRRVIFGGLLVSGASALYVVNGNHSTLVGTVSRLAPNVLVAEAAVGKSSLAAIAILFGLTVLALFAARWSFSQSLKATTPQSNNRKAPSLLFYFPLSWRGLAAKDFRYSLRLLDPYFGVLISAPGCLYLISSAAPTATAVMVVILCVFIPSAALAFNSFGLDTRSGMDRYGLLPAAGTAIIRSKNLAFAIIMSAQVLPLILLSGWRLGLLTSFATLVQAASLAMAYMSWGNWMSVTLPSRMHFYRFAPTTGAITEIIAGVTVNSLPGVLILYLIRADGERAIWLAGPILLACVLSYFVATNLSGRRFEMNRQKIRDSLG